MLDVMKPLQGYLGEEFPPNKKVVSGGDQLTCEREANARRHMMDGDTPRDRLALLEPVCEYWHALMCKFYYKIPIKALGQKNKFTNYTELCTYFLSHLTHIPVDHLENGVLHKFKGPRHTGTLL